MSHWRQHFARFARGIAHAVLLGSLGLAGVAAQAEDDPPGRVGRIADMKGQVWLLEAGQGEWQAAERNRPITTADRLATDANARAEVQIGSTIVRLDEGSDLEVTRLDDERIELMLHDGTAAMRVREHEVAREILLITPEGRFQPRAAGLYRLDRTDRSTLAATTQGELDFESSDAQLSLRAGQRAELWFDEGDRRTHYNWAGMPTDDFEHWVRKDDARDERYATRRPISPEMTGADDLEGHGQWDTHPEYGALWYPTTVAVGWAPYRYGRWAWVRPWGWTWVDDAPWGFAPFHYGRWVHWHGRWAWAPGTYVRRPVYAPAMVAWVGGANFSVGMSFGRPVGWVPLAPREVYRPMYKVSPVYIKQVNVTHVHVHDHDHRKPVRPVQYRNSSVAGGVTVVSSDVLTRRERVHQAPRPSDNSVIAAMRGQRAVANVEPPKPADASFAPRQVRRPDARAEPRVAPPPSVRQVRRDDERRVPRPAADRGAAAQGAAVGRPGEPGRALPGASPREPQAARERAERPERVERSQRPEREERVPRPPISRGEAQGEAPRAPQREIQRDAPREIAPAPQPRERDTPRREPNLMQQPQAPREVREPREPRGFTPPQREERSFQAPQPPRQERAERPERIARQEVRQERAERQQQREERPERQDKQERQERKKERGERESRVN